MISGFHGNKLGFQIPPTPPKCGSHTFGVKLPATSTTLNKPCTSCTPPATVAYPLSYESETLQPYSTFVVDSNVFVNSVKTIAHAGYLFTLAITSQGVTCISRVQAADMNGLTRQTVLLQSPNPSNPSENVTLQFGCSMVAMDKFVYVCGSNAGMPCIAKINADTLDILVSAGNGERPGTDISAEEYYDITVGFCVTGISSSPLLAVCGFIVIDDVAYPSFRLIDPISLLPVGIFGTGRSYNINTEKSYSRAVSLCANPALGVYNILVSAEPLGGIQSSIWTLSKDGTSLLSVLQYNDPTTNNLRIQGGLSSAYGLQIACLETGSVFVLTRGITSPSSSLPSEVVALYQFTPDTAPAIGFGDSGIVVWWDRSVGASYSSKLLLSECHGQVFVVGNALAPSSAPNDINIYYGGNYNYPIRTESSNLEFVPFVLKIAVTDGCSSLVLHGLPNCPCNNFLFAVDLCYARPGLFYVSGMVGKDILTTPSIMSGLLTLFMSIHTNPARVINCAPVAVNLMNGYCNGIIGLYNPCAPSTVLQVHGPIIVGNCQNPPLIPGTIRFEDGALLVWDGSAWKTVVWT